MNDSQKRLLAALAVVGLIVGATGGGVATVSIDTATTSDATTTQSEVTDDTVIQHEANASDRHIIQVNFTSSTNEFVDPVLWVRLNESGSDLNKTVFAKNTTPTNLTYQSGGTSYDPSTNFNLSITEDELADVPIKPGQNRTLDFIVFPSNASKPADADQANVTAATITLEENANRSVVYIGDHAVDTEDEVETTDEDPDSFAGIEFDSPEDDRTELDVASQEINGTDTDELVIILANDTAATDYDDVFGDLDDGTWTADSVLRVEDEAVPVFESEVPDWVDDSDRFEDSTTAIRTSVGGEDALLIEPGDEQEDADSVDVTGFSNADLGEQADHYGWASALGLGEAVNV